MQGDGEEELEEEIQRVQVQVTEVLEEEPERGEEAGEEVPEMLRKRRESRPSKIKEGQGQLFFFKVRINAWTSDINWCNYTVCPAEGDLLLNNG